MNNLIAQSCNLNTAQSLIYSFNNIERAYPYAFQWRNPDEIVDLIFNKEFITLVANDGEKFNCARDLIRESFVSFTSRLKNFFSYLGPDYCGPNYWKNNSYVLLKGHCYTCRDGKNSASAKLQAKWLGKFPLIENENSLMTLLENLELDLGHLVKPDDETPSCSCLSYRRQVDFLSEFQEEIPGYTPTCIHLTWINKFRNFLTKRTLVREEMHRSRPQTVAAWTYIPPASHGSSGQFKVIFSRDGEKAPVSKWIVYKPKELFTEKDAWKLFDSMLDKGYIPYAAPTLPQLSKAFKSWQCI